MLSIDLILGSYPPLCSLHAYYRLIAPGMSHNQFKFVGSTNCSDSSDDSEKGGNIPGAADSLDVVNEHQNSSSIAYTQFSIAFWYLRSIDLSGLLTLG